MLVVLQSVVPDEVLGTVVESLGEGEFVEGKLTAGADAADRKRNLQLVRGSSLASVCGDAVKRALMAHPGFMNASRPSVVLTPLFAKYRAGMEYGSHLDNPIMNEGRRIRTDVSITVFLSPKEAYEGGDLVIETDLGEQRVRGDAGDVAVYSSGHVHRVDPVTDGERLVAITWAQSLVRNPDRRRILYEIALARDEVRESLPGSRAAERLHQCHDNLLRLWAEP